MKSKHLAISLYGRERQITQKQVNTLSDDNSHLEMDGIHVVSE